MLPKNFMLIHILFYFFLLMWRFKILIGCFSYMYIYVCVCVSGDLSLVDLFNWLHDVLFMKDFYLILWDVKSFKSFVKTSILVNLFVFFCVIACFFVFGGVFLLFFFQKQRFNSRSVMSRSPLLTLVFTHRYILNTGFF